MTTPEPQSNFLQTINNLAKELPMPARFVVVLLLLLIMFLLFGATIPDNLLPLLYILMVAGLIGYAGWEILQYKERTAIRDHELKRLTQEQQHNLATQQLTNQPSNKPANQLSEATPTTNQPTN